MATTSRKRMFIPDASNSSKNKFITTLGWLVLIVGFVLCAGVFLLAYNYTDKHVNSTVAVFLIRFIFTGVAVFLYCRALLTFTFRKHYLKSKFYRYKQNQHTNPGKFWGISYMNDDGRIIYTSGLEAYIVIMEKGYSIGRYPGFKHDHYDRLTDAFNFLMQEGYICLYNNYNIGEPNTKPLDETSRILSRFVGSKLYKLAQIFVGFIRQKVEFIPSELEFMVVAVQGYSEKALRMYEDVNKFIEIIGKTLYEKSYIADEKLAVDITRRYFDVNSMNMLTLSRRHGYDTSYNPFQGVKEFQAAKVISADSKIRSAESVAALEEMLKAMSQNEQAKTEDTEVKEQEVSDSKTS